MRVALLAVCLMCGVVTAPAMAQTGEKPSGKTEYSTGCTKAPETAGQKQPRGWTGPTETGSGGAACGKPTGAEPARDAGRSGKLVENHCGTGQG